jgi:hypothetical protein
MANYNPPVKNFFKTDRQESCTAKLSVRVPPSLLGDLKSLENWQEFVRLTLKQAIDAKKINSSN